MTPKEILTKLINVYNNVFVYNAQRKLLPWHRKRDFDRTPGAAIELLNQEERNALKQLTSEESQNPKTYIDCTGPHCDEYFYLKSFEEQNKKLKEDFDTKIFKLKIG